MVQAGAYGCLLAPGALLLRAQAALLATRRAASTRHLNRVALLLLVAALAAYVAPRAAGPFRAGAAAAAERALAGGLVGAGADAADADAAAEREDPVDFKCRLPEALRLQGNCWVEGAVGEYEGQRTENGRMVDGKSQFSEDEMLLEHFFFDRTGGTFIEMGGLDGLRYSNTYFFEAQRDWRGLMVEGSPTEAAKLFRNRPKAITVNAMICGEKRDLHWLDNPDGGAVSGAFELIEPNILKRHYDAAKLEELVANAPIVPCIPLGTLLSKFSIQHVDLFSLDVEGAELSVLKTIDFSKFSASVLMLEVEGRGLQTAPPVLYMREQGYFDYGYVNKNYIFLHPRFVETLPKPLKMPEGAVLASAV